MLYKSTKQQDELRKVVRKFAEESVKPLTFLMDKENMFPDDAVEQLGKMGLMGIPYPKEYGGADMDMISYKILFLLLLELRRKRKSILFLYVRGKSLALSDLRSKMPAQMQGARKQQLLTRAATIC